MATRYILLELSRRYQTLFGKSVTIAAMGGVDAARLVRAGEVTDIVVLASRVMTKLEAEERVVAGSVTSFAQSGIAIAVRAGTSWPDIANEDAVRAAVRAANKVAYSTGPSGDHVRSLCLRWDIPPDDENVLVRAPAGIPVGSLVARGEAELGFQQLSELIHEPGIEIVGALPPEIQSETVFAIGIASSSFQKEAAAQLIEYWQSPACDAVKRAHGMQPAEPL